MSAWYIATSDGYKFSRMSHRSHGERARFYLSDGPNRREYDSWCVRGECADFPVGSCYESQSVFNQRFDAIVARFQTGRYLYIVLIPCRSSVNEDEMPKLVRVLPVRCLGYNLITTEEGMDIRTVTSYKRIRIRIDGLDQCGYF